MQSETAHFAIDAATWRTGQKLFDFGPFTPLCNNVASSTKLEVNNVHCHQRRTESFTEKLVKFVCGFLTYASGQTNPDRHTYMLIAILHIHTRDKVKNRICRKTQKNSARAVVVIAVVIFAY